MFRVAESMAKVLPISGLSNSEKNGKTQALGIGKTNARFGFSDPKHKFPKVITIQKSLNPNLALVFALATASVQHSFCIWQP